MKNTILFIIGELLLLNAGIFLMWANVPFNYMTVIAVSSSIIGSVFIGFVFGGLND
jgi:hypothetical protein